MNQVLTVSEYIQILNTTLRGFDAVLQGELGEVNDQYPNYTYFTLRDKHTSELINCMVSKYVLQRNAIRLKQGEEVQLQGQPNVYGRTGKLTFIANRIQLVGEGALQRAFEELKAKLQKIGYFDPANKKEIPQYPRHIGIVTSPHGDALNDFRTNIGNFGLKISLYPVKVEGIYAQEEIVQGIRYFNEHTTDVDIVVLSRGGTGLENLQPFNSEQVAKSIYASRIPIVTGIGHENDTTIADMVADLRASTPTAAARAISENWRNAKFHVNDYKQSLYEAMKALYNEAFHTINHYDLSFITSIEYLISQRKQNLKFLKNSIASLCRQLIANMKQKEDRFRTNYQILLGMHRNLKLALLNQEKYFQTETTQYINSLAERITAFEKQLRTADPSLKLKQGYSIIFNESGAVVKSTEQLIIGNKLNIRLGTGKVKSTVEEIQ